MKKEQIPYDCQIFVCTNDRKGERPSCGDHDGVLIGQELKRLAKAAGIHPRIRVTQAKCLGQCLTGVNIMIYPGNVWLSQVRKEDIPTIVEQFFSPRNESSAL